MRNHKVPVGLLSFQCFMVDQDIFDNGSIRRVLCADLNELLNQHDEGRQIDRITLEEFDAAFVYGTDLTVWRTYPQHVFIWRKRVVQEVLQLYPAGVIFRKQAQEVSELPGEFGELEVAKKSLQVVGCIEARDIEEICEANSLLRRSPRVAQVTNVSRAQAMALAMRTFTMMSMTMLQVVHRNSTRGSLSFCRATACTSQRSHRIWCDQPTPVLADLPLPPPMELPPYQPTPTPASPPRRTHTPMPIPVAEMAARSEAVAEAPCAPHIPPVHPLQRHIAPDRARRNAMHIALFGRHPIYKLFVGGLSIHCEIGHHCNCIADVHCGRSELSEQQAFQLLKRRIVWGYVDGRGDCESSRKRHMRLPGHEPILAGYLDARHDR